MTVLGVVGSPRKEKGITSKIVARILTGAESGGATTKVLYLMDENLEYCVHCEYPAPCFADGICRQDARTTKRSQLVDAADALVIGAPVYCWQPSGLTMCFFDRHRARSGSWSKGMDRKSAPAVGVAVAGGTGSGVFTALHSIYSWLCAWKYRPLEPVPVTRFNFDRVMESVEGIGQKLVNTPCDPFSDTGQLMHTYDSLPFMDYSRIDEFHWLAEQIAYGLRKREQKAEVADQIDDMLSEALEHADQGNRSEAAKVFLNAYSLGAQAW